jgi:hypothetical protein
LLSTWWWQSVALGGAGVFGRSLPADHFTDCALALSAAHTAMVPYWSQQLGKIKMKAIQLSKRRGYLDCELAGERVLMSGKAVTYLTGEIYV